MAKEGVTRRLAAILATDVVGYSRLMSVDEAGTLARMTAHLDEIFKPAIAEHQGHVVKTTGDGLLAEFASAVEAVECAVQIQTSMADRAEDEPEDRRVVFRIGINLGDIIIQDGDIFGDGVNVAARIEALADPGGVFLSQSVADQIAGKLDTPLEDLGKHEVKNIPKPVHVFRMLLDGAKPGQPFAKAAKPKPQGRIWAISAAAIAAASIAAVVLWPSPPTQPEKTAPAPLVKSSVKQVGKPSVAILPFVNMSGDKEQEYFSDGMTEDLITDLSKVSALMVIARTSTFAYKGKVDDIRTIAKELNVRYVVEGSVRKAGGKVRITAQLIDAETGKHLWADRYDRNFKDVFALQDEVLGKIVAALKVTLTPVEKKRMARPLTTSPDAYDLYLKGLRQESFFTKNGNLESRKLFERAIELDPGFASAYAHLAQAHDNAVVGDWSVDKAADYKLALILAEKAVVLDPDLPYARWGLSRVLAHQNFDDRAFAEMKKAIELNPNYAGAYAYMTFLYIRAGRAEEGLPSIEKAMRMNPGFPFWYYHALAMVQFALERFEAAAANLEKAVERNPNVTWLRTFLAASYANMGNQGDAEWQVEELRAQGYKKSVDEIIESTHFRFPAYKKLFSDGLRKAGLK
ncbi:MAG: adenylate/guanylate cyclase domain-containing protein [Rhodospirillales bacterium]|nr:adenylate/guanylate cyclase domain-containing protein [Rhodospirillales bacterium]